MGSRCSHLVAFLHIVGTGYLFLFSCLVLLTRSNVEVRPSTTMNPRHDIPHGSQTLAATVEVRVNAQGCDSFSRADGSRKVKVPITTTRYSERSRGELPKSISLQPWDPPPLRDTDQEKTMAPLLDHSHFYGTCEGACGLSRIAIISTAVFVS